MPQNFFPDLLGAPHRGHFSGSAAGTGGGTAGAGCFEGGGGVPVVIIAPQWSQISPPGVMVDLQLGHRTGDETSLMGWAACAMTAPQWSQISSPGAIGDWQLGQTDEDETLLMGLATWGRIAPQCSQISSPAAIGWRQLTHVNVAISNFLPFCSLSFGDKTSFRDKKLHKLYSLSFPNYMA